MIPCRHREFTVGVFLEPNEENLLMFIFLLSEVSHQTLCAFSSFERATIGPVAPLGNYEQVRRGEDVEGRRAAGSLWSTGLCNRSGSENE